MSDPLIDHRAMMRAKLTAIARRQGLGAEDARDAVQEALCRCVAMKKCSKGCSECGLLTTLVVNEARNMRRKHHRARPHLTDEQMLAAIADEQPLPEALVAAREDTHQLEGCIATLPDVPRKIVSLRIIEDVSAPEIARALDLTPNHVAVVLSRAKKALSSCMGR